MHLRGFSQPNAAEWWCHKPRGYPELTYFACILLISEAKIAKLHSWYAIWARGKLDKMLAAQFKIDGKIYKAWF